MNPKLQQTNSSSSRILLKSWASVTVGSAWQQLPLPSLTVLSSLPAFPGIRLQDLRFREPAEATSAEAVALACIACQRLLSRFESELSRHAWGGGGVG